MQGASMEAGRMVRKLLHITITIITTVNTTGTCILHELHSRCSQSKAAYPAGSVYTQGSVPATTFCSLFSRTWGS